METERRQITVLFCDLVGSTPLSEQLDPEDYAELLQSYYAVCGQAIEEFHGHVHQLLGDGILALFGYPDALEDSARLAVAAGLESIERATKLRAGEGYLQVRAGIDTGWVVLSELQAGEHRKRVALGEAMNRAARVQGVAPPNTVLITDATWRQTRGYFEAKEQVADALKGVSRPVTLYLVEGNRPVGGRLEAAAASKSLTPYVGRKVEMEFLAERWRQVRAGERQLVEVCGEPGIGKSRLVRMLTEQVDSADICLVCRCAPYHQNSPLQPVIELLEKELSFGRNDTVEQKSEQLVKWLSTLEPLPHALPLLTNLLHPKSQLSSLAELTPEMVRQKTLETLEAILRQLAATRPLLLILDDVHWADPSTLELIGMLTTWHKDAAILLCLTYRQEFHPPWQGAPNRTVIQLERMLKEESATLVKLVAGNKNLPSGVCEQIIARAEGVPLFVEEITKAVLESGTLVEYDDRYELSGKIPDQMIPDTVSDSLVARIDRLGDAKPIALIAATIGREFSYELLEAVKPDADLLPGLEKLETAELVFRAGEPPDAVYTFKHALIRDAAYASLARKTKQRYHKQIAETLEARFPTIRQRQPEVLAEHYNGAGLFVQAMGYWHNAGARDVERTANYEAIGHLESALKALEKVPDSQQRRTNELALQILLMPAYMATMGWAAQEVEASCARVCDLCDKLSNKEHLKIEALWGLWTVRFVRGELRGALRAAERVLTMASTAGVKMLEVAGHHAVGFTHYYRGELLEANEHATRGLQLFDLETEQLIVNTFQFSSTMALRFFRAGTLWFLGRHQASRRELEDAARLIADLNHAPSSAAFMAFILSWYFYTQDTKSIRETVAKLMEVCEAKEFRLYVPVGMMYRGWALAHEGETEEGVRQMEEGMELYRRTKSSIKFVEVIVMYAEVLRRLNRIQDALQVLQEGMDQAITREEHLLEPELYRIRGEIRGAQGRQREAALDLDRAIEIARRQRALSLELRATISKCRLSKTAEALLALQRVCGFFRDEPNSPDLEEARDILKGSGCTI